MLQVLTDLNKLRLNNDDDQFRQLFINSTGEFLKELVIESSTDQECDDAKKI